MNMIEKVARAMCKSECIDPDECVLGSGGTDAELVCSVRGWELYKHKAIAALAALMEPTDGMIIAGCLNEDRRIGYEEALKAALDGK